ncbi:MAG: hypothetical protein QXK65_01730 [Candidatus Micrarchaeaceae archaeon]
MWDIAENGDATTAYGTNRLRRGWVASAHAVGSRIGHLLAPTLFMLFFIHVSYGAGSVQLLSQLEYIKTVLSQVGPALSAVLFVVAGIFYAIGQMLPPDKKANFHTTAINIIIGAIVVGILSVASTSLAAASTHLLSNFTAANAAV